MFKQHTMRKPMWEKELPELHGKSDNIPSKAKGTMRQYDDREFVKVWMTTSTASGVAKRLGRNVNSVHSKAFSLRKKGVKLPKKYTRADTNSVSELNKLVDKYKKKDNTSYEY